MHPPMVASAAVTANEMVGEEGLEPSSPFGQWILSPSCMPVPPLAQEDRRWSRDDRLPQDDRLPRDDRWPRDDRLPQDDRLPRDDTEGCAKKWRRHPDSNREYKALQASALPIWLCRPRAIHRSERVLSLSTAKPAIVTCSLVCGADFSRTAANAVLRHLQKSPTAVTYRSSPWGCRRAVAG